MWLQIILCVLICSVYLFYWTFSRNNKNKPPTIKNSLPFIGFAHRCMGDTKDLFKLVERITGETQANGGVMHGYIGTLECYIVTDADDCMTVANNCLEKSVIYDFAKCWLGDGLVTVTRDIPKWKRHRKIANKSFNQQVLDSFLETFNKEARGLVEDVAETKEQPFDHSQLILKRQLKNIIQTALGVSEGDICNFTSQKYGDGVKKILNIIARRAQSFWMHSDAVYRWTSMKKEEAHTIAVLHEMSTAIINKKRSDLLSGEPKNKVKAFLDLLLELPEEDAFTDEEIKEEVDTMIVAGFDTTSYMITYAVSLLGSHHDIQQRVFDEIKEIFGTSTRDVEKQDFVKLVYMEAVLKETMRLFPILPLAGRYVAKDTKLKNYTMSAGSDCFFSIYGINRDRSLWGPDADKFRPGRWFDAVPQHPAAFAGFSLGRRACVGKVYAMNSMKVVLVHLIRKYEFASDISQLVLKLDSLLKPAEGCEVIAKPRILN